MKKKLATLLHILQSRLLGYAPGYPILKCTDTCKVEILADRDFQQSCREVNRFTCLDTPAWQTFGIFAGTPTRKAASWKLAPFVEAGPCIFPIPAPDEGSSSAIPLRALNY